MAERHPILIVDDEPGVVRSLEALLRLDYKVYGATRAREGLDILSRNEIHVVMTDQRMPEMSGVEFLHRIREDFPNVIRLLFTGYADTEAVIEAINRGSVYRYIEKPWNTGELMGVLREACERYELIDERRKLISELERRSQSLERANAELRRADELKQAFIRVASHELRTPLTILMGLVELIGRGPDAASIPPDWNDRVRRSGQRMQDLIDQIIAMLAVGRYEIPLDRRPADLAALLRQAADDVLPFVERRRQSLALDIPEGLGTADLDLPKIRDGLNQLLLNAVKFTPDGGRISLSAVRLPEGGVTIRVTDTGVGIDPSSLPLVFDPFFTGFDISRHSSGRFEFLRKGLGLGLSVAKAFVEMHGGKIEVESEVGRGTTFTIRLPT